MEKIKNVEELRKQRIEELIKKQELEKFSDDEVGERLAFYIKSRNKSGENKITIYKEKYPLTARDYRYEYIKKHKIELKEKGYKVNFSYINTLAAGCPAYTIRW